MHGFALPQNSRSNKRLADETREESTLILTQFLYATEQDHGEKLL